MKYLIIAFKSRDVTMAFSRVLKNKYIPHNIINTPHNISAGCSLSVYANISYKPIIMETLACLNCNAINGVFIVEKINGFERIERLI